MKSPNGQSRVSQIYRQKWLSSCLYFTCLYDISEINSQNYKINFFLLLSLKSQLFLAVALNELRVQARQVVVTQPLVVHFSKNMEWRKWGKRKIELHNWGIHVHYLTISFKNTKVHCSLNVRPTIPLFNLVFSNARTSWRSQQIIKGAALISMQRCTTNFSRKTKVM